MTIEHDFYYRILPGEDISSICKKLGISKECIRRNDTTIDIYVGEWIKVKVENCFYHIVKPMENLDSISKIYNISIDTLINDNSLKTSKLFIGQRLKILKVKD